MCSLDFREQSPCTSPWTYNNLTDGKHHFKVYASDPSVGFDPIGAIHEWRVDTLAPSTSLQANPTGPDSYSVDLFSSEANSTFACSMDGSPEFSCLSPYKLQGLAPGPHELKVFAIDEAGNIDPQGASFQFTTVIVDPITTQITSIDPASTYTNINQVTFDFIASKPASGFLCTLAGVATNCTPPYSYANLPDAEYTFKVQAIDVWGNMDAIGASYTWTVDTTPPIATVTRLDTTSTIVTITWTTNEPATTELQWGQGASPNRPSNGNSQLNTVHSVQIAGLSSNTPYVVQPMGVDRAGNRFQMSPLFVRTKR